jgi:hypothetical protein
MARDSKKIVLPNGRQIMARTWEQYRGDPDPATGCREWQGVRSNIGYGFIGWNTPGRGTKEAGYYGQMTVHRVALMLKLGRAIAPGMNANHSCHNKLCTEETHLSEGSQQQKIHDMMRDGVTTFGSDQKPYNHKQAGRKYRYSEADINWCRDASVAEIQKRYGFEEDRAAGFRHGMRNNYRWLPWPNRDLVVPGRPGRRPKPLTTDK